METIRVKRLSRRYHLSPSQRDLERAFGETLDLAIHHHLEDALEPIRHTDEEVCVRRVRVPLGFRVGKSPFELAGDWSRRIASGIEEALAQGGDNVVRYASRWHALLDFALEVSCGRLQRAWAWNQTGWSSLGESASLTQARRQLLDAMLRQPAQLPVLLVFLARRQRLMDLLLGCSADERVTLLYYALLAAGAQPGWLATDAPWLGDPPQNTATQAVAAGDLMVADLTQTAIGRQWLADPQAVAALGVPAHFWAALALLELEPGLFHRGSAAVARRLRSARMQWLSPSLDPAQQPPHWRSGRPEAPVPEPLTADGSPPTRPSEPAASPPQVHTASAAIGSSAQAQAPQSITPAQPESPASRAALFSSPFAPPSANAPNSTVSTPGAAAQPPDFFPRSYASVWGGLFYLLPLLALRDPVAEGVFASLAGAETLAGRSLGWILHQLLCHCAHQAGGEVAEEDPALRLLGGQDLRLPPADVPAPSAAERALLETEAQCLMAQLQARLPARSESPGALWLWLCRRPAQLQLDGAWVEVVFPLKNLDTDIRRAGLDLDPGYVPWLGQVVRLRYE